jgi:hypothetical protein
MSLAEHGLLPDRYGRALLELRALYGGMSIVGSVWFAFQMSWIVPVAIRIFRDGLGRAIEAFRLAGVIGVSVGLPLALVAMLAIFLLGPLR